MADKDPPFTTTNEVRDAGERIAEALELLDRADALMLKAQQLLDGCDRQLKRALARHLHIRKNESTGASRPSPALMS